jgi:DNA-binding NtrC family response regulator
MADNPVVLVVDDDAELRDVLVAGLEAAGMTIIDAATGQDALRVLAGDPTIGVLVSDILMPGISGRTLAQRAQEMRPGLRVVLTSGYGDEAPRDGTPWLHKPFRVETLRDLIRELMLQ